MSGKKIIFTWSKEAYKDLIEIPTASVDDELMKDLEAWRQKVRDFEEELSKALILPSKYFSSPGNNFAQAQSYRKEKVLVTVSKSKERLVIDFKKLKEPVTDLQN